jgi:hypothetical protein
MSLIWAGYRTRYKIASIILVSCFYIATFKGIEDLMGWPTTAITPEEFRTVWISIEEPDKQSQTPGAIYYWLRELDNAGIPRQAPRAYRVDWSVQTAMIAQAALTRLEQGEILNGRQSRNILKNEEANNKNQQSIGASARAGNQQGRPTFEFTAVSSPTLPLKPSPESQLRD